MSRAPIVYANGEQTSWTYDAWQNGRAGSGYSVETPTAGWYRFRMVAGGHPVAIRIWHGPPHDPVTGEEMDRGWRWQATMNGEPVDLDRVWPACGREPITATEAAYLTGVDAWAQANAPDSPQANPRMKIDLLSPATPMPW